MDRVFLDANVLFSASYKSTSGLRRLWKLAHEGKVILITSSYAVEEARRNLSGATRLTALERLLRLLEIGPGPSSPGLQPGAHNLPAKDIPILQAAISMKATHLVTGDFTHFGSLYGKKIEGVVIISPGEYLRGR